MKPAATLRSTPVTGLSFGSLSGAFSLFARAQNSLTEMIITQFRLPKFNIYFSFNNTSN